MSAAPRRDTANAEAFRRLTTADPVLLDVRPAGEVVPGFTRDTILTSGPTMPWAGYVGGQRAAVIGAARFEGLAATDEEADRKLAEGTIKVRGCQELKCVGSLAGPYSASMPVFVVQNRAYGNTAYCNIYEGVNHRRLNYGVYDEGVRDRLRYVGDVIAPALGKRCAPPAASRSSPSWSARSTWATTCTAATPRPRSFSAGNSSPACFPWRAGTRTARTRWSGP